MVFFVHNSPTAFLRPPKINLTFLIERITLQKDKEMPCSQCGWSGHNIKTCINYQFTISPDVLSMPITADEFNPPEVIRESTSNNPYPDETKSINNLPQDCPLLELDYGILTEQIGPIVQQIRRKKYCDRMDFIFEQLMWYPKRYLIDRENAYFRCPWTGIPVDYAPGRFHLVLFLLNWNIDYKKIKQLSTSLEIIVDHIRCDFKYLQRWELLNPRNSEQYYEEWIGKFIQALKDIDIPLVYLEEVYAEYLDRPRKKERKENQCIRRSLLKEMPNYVEM